MRQLKFSGFTLIELLVVIAIIAILAAILFPVFAKAREKARQTQCINNQKQIATAVQMYAQEHDEKFPPAQTFWTDIDVPNKVKQCPSVGKNIANAYVYNSHLSNIALGDVPSPTSTFVSCDGQHAATTAPKVTYDNVAYSSTDLNFIHNSQTIVAYADGHAAASSTGPVFVVGDWAFAQDRYGNQVTDGQTIADSMMFDASGNGYYGHPTAGAKYTAYSIPSGGRGYDGFAYDSSGGSMIQFYDVQDIIKRSNNFSIWCRVRMNSKQTTEANIIEKNMTNGFSLKYLATGKLECTVGGMMGKYSNWLLDGSGPTIENDNTTWHDYGLSIQKEANTKTLARIYMDGKIVKTAEYMSSVNTNGWLLFGSTAALYDRVAYYDGVLDLDGFKALSDGGTL